MENNKFLFKCYYQRDIKTDDGFVYLVGSSIFELSFVYGEYYMKQFASILCIGIINISPYENSPVQIP